MTKNSHRTLVGALTAALLAGSAWATVALADTPGTRTQPAKREPVATIVDKPLVETYLRAWPERPAQVARQLMDKYGLPAEATPSMLIWRDNGPFKKTVVHREEVAHNFPTPHWDFLEQVVQLRVPVTKIDDVAAFDGSLVVKRTQGLVSVRCDSEAHNILALNLANDVATGKKSATQARAALGKAVTALAKGEAVEDARTLRLPASATDATADPDKATMKAPAQEASPADVTTPATPSTIPSPGVPATPKSTTTPDDEPITTPKVLPPGTPTPPTPAPPSPNAPRTPGLTSPRK